MPTTYIKRILEAKVYDAAVETPIQAMRQLSREMGCQVLVKREDLQPVFSFKIRGASNKVAQIPPERLRRGVIAASAGNHAQGVALAASRRGIRAVIVMPGTTPRIKTDSVREYGAEVILHGDRFDEARVHAMDLAVERDMEFIHPYDDPDVIAGQGTIGMEIVRQHQAAIDVLFLPVGGGGLAAGVAAYVRYVRPSTRIVGVESEESACLLAAWKAGRRVRLPRVGIFADGVAVAQIGREPFRVLQLCMDDVITVSDDEICGAIKDLFDDTRSIAEPAGAVGLAGLKKYAETHDVSNKTLMTIESGANVNFDTLRYISERAEIGEKREMLLAVRIPERAGALRALCGSLHGCDLTLINYRYSGPDTARILLGVEPISSVRSGKTLVPCLRAEGFAVKDLSSNELVKLHTAQMIGGRCEGLSSEVVFQVELPERPGILSEFLDGLGERWNITLFHYRKQGGACAQVFIGFHAGRADVGAIRARMKAMKLAFSEETANPAYRLFIGPQRAGGRMDFV